MIGKLVFAGLLAAVSVQGALARDVELRRSVKVGEETPIIAHSLFRGECETKSPDIKILRQPQNGTAVVKTGKRTFPKGGKGNMAKCDGKSGVGSAVHYTPKKDFQGFDTVQYEVDTNSGKNKVTVRIRVGTPPQLKNEGWVKPQ